MALLLATRLIHPPQARREHLEHESALARLAADPRRRVPQVDRRAVHLRHVVAVVLGQAALGQRHPVAVVPLPIVACLRVLLPRLGRKQVPLLLARLRRGARERAWWSVIGRCLRGEWGGRGRRRNGRDRRRRRRGPQRREDVRDRGGRGRGRQERGASSAEEALEALALAAARRRVLLVALADAEPKVRERGAPPPPCVVYRGSCNRRFGAVGVRAAQARRRRRRVAVLARAKQVRRPRPAHRHGISEIGRQATDVVPAVLGARA